jgi:heme-degrading monooxygenase HmoA
VIAQTPEAPYFSVIFTSKQTDDTQGYSEMAILMEELAKKQSGYLGIESARNEIGITVSYWKDTDSILNWKANVEHQLAQKIGREKWYASYKIRICKVERDYGFHLNQPAQFFIL